MSKVSPGPPRITIWWRDEGRTKSGPSSGRWTVWGWQARNRRVSGILGVVHRLHEAWGTTRLVLPGTGETPERQRGWNHDKHAPPTRSQSTPVKRSRESREMPPPHACWVLAQARRARRGTFGTLARPQCRGSVAVAKSLARRQEITTCVGRSQRPRMSLLRDSGQ